jgi:regulatory protein
LTDSQNKAKKYAVKLLGYRGRSEKELKERLLKKGISKTVASSTVQDLKRLGLIDDRSLAESLKREAFSRKFLSQQGAVRFLHHRGIPHKIIIQVLDDDEIIDIYNARKLIRKKIKNLRNYSPLHVKKKLYGLLARRGYSSDTIHKVLKENTFQEEDS